MEYIKQKISDFRPLAGLILGSGLSVIGDTLTDVIEIPYADIPDFPTSTVKGHVGRLLCGYLEKVPVVCMQGRFHLYEGYSKEELTVPLKVLKTLGCETLILTNAAGSLDLKIPPGSLVLIDDHINFSGINPLVGPNDESWGPRFFDMSDTYDSHLRRKISKLAEKEKIKLHRGCYLYVTGPSFETPAEIRMFKSLGATAVGMSTVPEAIIARYLGMRVLGISTITNYGAGISDKPITHADTLAQGAKISARLERLIREFFKNWYLE
jgi:inosine/guanosine/xanthosine phosphorylase family protein